MTLSPIRNSASINYVTENDAAQLAPLNQWVNDAPQKEANDRNNIAGLVKKAQLDGMLRISCSGITSLPPIPEGVSTLSISDCNSLLVLPNSLKNLDLTNCPGLKISYFPPCLEKITVKNGPSYKDFPVLPDGLLHFSADSKCLPSLPAGLLTLSVSGCNGLITLPDLPGSLEELEIKDSICLPRLLALPDKLKKLNLTNAHSITNLATPPPSNLNILEIDSCENIKFPTELPSNLSQIKLFGYVDEMGYSNEYKVWSILPQNLPPRVHLILSQNIKFDPEILKLPGVTFGAMFSEPAQNFRSGDILYGTTGGAQQLCNIITDTNNFSKKDIVKQSTLTNSVFLSSRTDFKTDDEIKKKLSDYGRGLEFKKFLVNHDRYNVMKEEFVNLTRNERWNKTSKAGLEFQTKVRERTVFFCVDELVDSIPDIASKSGPHGDAISAHELRWLYRHRDDDKVKENVQFYLQGRPISHESVFSLKGWDTYQPKNTVKKSAD